MTATNDPPFGSEWSASFRRGTDSELRGWLEVAMAACDEADVTARAHFRRDLVIETKPDRSFVTQADKAIEQMIRERLHSAFPDHGMIGEEFGTEAAEASVRWYIDPIDGTHNFMRGVPLFGTLLAVERDGELQAGVLSAPALDERWWGWRGGGAWARNRGQATRRVSVSAVSRLEDSPHPVRLGPGHRRVGPRAGVRSPAPRRLARTRLRGFLGICAARRGRRRGDDRGRALALGRCCADAAHRGGRRPGDRLAGPPPRRHRHLPRIQRTAPRDDPAAIARGVGRSADRPGAAKEVDRSVHSAIEKCHAGARRVRSVSSDGGMT